MKQIKASLLFLLIIIFLLTGCGKEYDSAYNEFPSTEGNSFDDSGSTSSNSISAYPTIEKAQNAIGFAFSAPTTPPAGYSLEEISVVKDADTSFAQINYKKEAYNIIYRVSQTTADLNADRNKYDKEKTIIVSEADIICSCNDDIVFVAAWQKDGCFYCIMSDEGLDTTTLSILILSIQ